MRKINDGNVTLYVPDNVKDFHLLADMVLTGKVMPDMVDFHEKEPTIKVKATFKGGPGSGFAGHAGIPGHQGGSQSGNAPEPRIYDEEKAAVGPGWGKLNGVLQGWAIAEEASDSNMAILQGAAAHVFGGNADEAQYNRLMSRTDYRGNLMYDKAEFEQALKNLYEYTQSKLKEEYPSGEITLYRALHNIYDESVYPLAGKVALSNKVLSSWASTKEGTTQAIEYWGRDMGYRLLEAHVPIKDILAYPGSTFALMSHDEDEFIVISTGTPVQADIIDAEAYVRKEKVKARFKGGEGSGFHGHVGIPGHQGGSQAIGYNFEEERDALMEPAGPQGYKPKAGVTRDQIAALYARKAIIDAATRFRYRDGSTAKETVDKAFADGFKIIGTKPARLILGNDKGESFSLNDKASIDYAKLVYGEIT